MFLERPDVGGRPNTGVFNGLVIRGKISSPRHLYTKPPLSVAAHHYLGEEGWGKWSIGWGVTGWGWGIHIPAAGFEAETTLCRKVNTGTGRRGRAGQRGLSQEKNKEIETEAFPIHTEI